MAEKWKPKDKKVYIDWILNLRGNEKSWSGRLTKWEQDFCYSLYSRLTDLKLDLTEAQAEKLESIYAEKSSF